MKKIMNIVGAALGVAAVIVGIALLTSTYELYTTDSAKFGADFYTYMHSATVSVHNALVYLYNLVRKAIGAAFILTGLTQTCVFATKLFEAKLQEKKDTAQAASEELPEI